jgi:hypothetical protein
MVVMFVREEYSIDFAERDVCHLLAKVGSTIEEDSIEVGFY